VEIFVYIFWISVFLLVYPYLIYPPLLMVLTRLFGGKEAVAEDPKEWPNVSFIISAYNEEAVIQEKIENTLSLDYPEGKLDIIVISDASSDRTDEIVNEMADKHGNIKLVRQEERKGKSAGLNHGIKETTGDVIVFSDANAMFNNDAIKELTRYFSNPDIGYVIGAALYNENKDSEATESEGLYWKFELFVKELESKFYSVVGGDGAIYATRKGLFWDLKDDDINDFVNPLQIVSKGYRGIINPKAICYEDAAENFDKEFGRKRRIVNRSWRAVTRYLSWFSPIQHFKFLFELFSHKVIRWYSLLIMVITLLSNVAILLIQPTPLYVVTLLGQIAFIITALIGANLDARNKPMPKLVYLPYYFCFVNLAGILGIIDQFRGIRHATWEHVRETQ